MDEQMIELSAQYGALIAKHTVGLISDKIRSIKAKNDTKEQLQEYEALVNILINDKMELERLTQEYKDAYEKVTISDTDIEYLQTTLGKTIDLILPMMTTKTQPGTYGYQEELANNRSNLELVVGLINKDTLKTFQLLGFNYKEAIGKPLTELCASKISSLGSKSIPVKGGRK